MDPIAAGALLAPLFSVTDERFGIGGRRHDVFEISVRSVIGPAETCQQRLFAFDLRRHLGTLTQSNPSDVTLLFSELAR